MPSDPEYQQNHRTLLYVNMRGKYNAELGIIQLSIYYMYDDAGVQSTRDRAPTSVLEILVYRCCSNQKL